jgi:hypothetical protein
MVVVQKPGSLGIQVAGPRLIMGCLVEPRELFCERVDVVSKYVYLGTNTPTNGLNWRVHADFAVAKAKQCSTYLL